MAAPLNAPKCRTCDAPLATGLPNPVCLHCSFTQALALGGSGSTSGIDGYELLYELGHGAMGVVWLARDRTLDRLVALKLIPTGSHPQLAQRLQREGQAAARLRHPHIVAVYAQGGTGASTYLAMDFLEGGNLDTVLAGKPMASRASAELIAKLAGALAHAHGAGILHRDIKPANILLDQQGKPHLADFGLAAPLGGAGDLTAAGQVAGTPAYLAPELLDGADQATAQSDVYSLGAVLYTCLTGRAPFIGESAASILTQLPQVDPPAPRLLQPTIPRDLETICLKCLEKAPRRRYPSADAFEQDLLRFIRGEPIAARPVGSLEKAVRWCRRHPAAATAGALASTILLLLAVGGPLVAIRLNRARRSAEEARSQTATEAATSREVVDFLQDDLLAQASPANQPDRDLKLRTVLDRAAKKVETRFSDRPLVEASILETLAKTYASLGEYAPAQHYAERAVELARTHAGETEPKTLSYASTLTFILIQQGKFAEAEAIGTKTLAQQQRSLGIDAPDTIKSLLNLEAVFQHRGKLDEAERLLNETIALAKKSLGPEHADTLMAQSDLAFLYRTKRNLNEAESLNKEVLAVRRRVLGADHPDTLASMTNLAAVYRVQAKQGEAEALFRELAETMRRVLGREHPSTLTAMNNLAVVFQEQGKFTEAESQLAEILEVSKRTLGPEHPNTIASMMNLAVVYQSEGKFPEAEALARQILELTQRVLGAESPTTTIATNNLATLLRIEGRSSEAEELSSKAVETSKKKRGNDHPDTWRFTANLALIYKQQRRYPEAEALCRQTLEARRRLLGNQHPETLQTLDALGTVLMEEGRFADAEPMLREALDGRAKSAPQLWSTAATRSELGEVLIHLRRFAEAEPLLLHSYEDLVKRVATIPAANRTELRRSCERLVDFYTQRADAKNAAKWTQVLKRDGL